MKDPKELPEGWQGDWEPVPPGTKVKVHPGAVNTPGVIVNPPRANRNCIGKNTAPESFSFRHFRAMFLGGLVGSIIGTVLVKILIQLL